MSDKKDRSKIPVMKSPHKIPQAVKPKPATPMSKIPHQRLLGPPLPAKSLAPASTLNSSDKIGQTRISGGDPIKKSVNSNTPFHPPQRSSYSEKYYKTLKRTGVGKEQQGILDTPTPKVVAYPPSGMQEPYKVVKRPKEKKVDFHLHPSPSPFSPLDSQENYESQPKTVLPSSFTLGIGIDVEMKKPEKSVNAIAWALEDDIKTDGVYFAESLGFSVDDHINEVKIEKPKSKDNIPRSVFVEKQVDSMEPISFLNPAGKKESKVPDFANEEFYDDGHYTEDDDENDNVMEQAEMAKEILQAVENENTLNKVNLLNQNSRDTVSDIWKEKEMDSNQHEKNMSFVKTDINPLDKPEGIMAIEQPDELDSVSDAFIPIPNVPNNISDENCSEDECSSTEKVVGRDEICTGIRKKKERLTVEEARQLHLGKSKSVITNGNRILDEVQCRIGWWKGLLLGMLLMIVTLIVVFIGWIVLQQHCEIKESKPEPSYMEWILSFIYTPTPTPVDNKPSSSWLGSIFDWT